MEVILLTDVEHVGLRGEVVSVARGYARNYLLPRRLAEEATKAKVAELQKRDARSVNHGMLIPKEDLDRFIDEAEEIERSLNRAIRP